MKNLFDDIEKQRRNTLAKRAERGSVSREEYLKEQLEKTDNKLSLLKKAMEQYPSATKVELAKKLGIGRTRLYELLKLL